MIDTRIINLIDTHLKKSNYLIIAIDGKSGAGKSTLANELSLFYNCPIIHTDDFYLPLEKRTPKRLEEPGGNIDYERFYNEVISSLNKKEIIYGKFSCSSMDIVETIKIKDPSIIIIEGSYSLHPYFKKYYDISIFLDISSQKQEKRILLRNGKENISSFLNKWIPMENKYFLSFDIPSKCDLIIEK